MPCAPTTAGICMLRERIAVCDSGPPNSVANAVDALMLQQHGLGGGQVIGQYDSVHRLPVAAIAVILVPVEQDAQDAIDDVIDIVAAGAQVRVVHLLEHIDDRIALQLESPLGVAAEFTDQFNRCRHQGGIVEHQQVRVDKRRYIDAGLRRNALADRFELTASEFHGGKETGDFAFQQVSGYGAFRHFDAVTHEVGLADGNAA